MLSAEVQLPLAETSDSETGLEHGAVTVLSMQMKLVGSTVGSTGGWTSEKRIARRGGILNSDRVLPCPGGVADAEDGMDDVPKGGGNGLKIFVGDSVC